ncbi:MAG: ATP-binding cassette domain-containing protein [Magnetovibrionaceae bacterium]
MSEQTPRSWLKPFMKPIWPVFREVLAMSAFVNILALAVPVFVMQVYDRVVFHAGITTLQGLVIGMIFVIAFDYILRQARSRIMQTVALRVDVEVGKRLFDKVMELPLHHLETKPASFWQSLFRDVDTIRNTLSGASAILVFDLPFAILFFVLIWVIAPQLAVVLMVMLPIFLFVAWRSSAAMAQANDEERKTTQNRDGLIAEIIQGRTTIKALALDKAMRPIWEDSHAANIENSIRRGTKTDAYTNFGQSLTMVTSILLTTVGALAILSQTLTMGSLIATNMLSGRMLGPLNQLVSQWRTFAQFFQAVDRLGEIFMSDSERTESEIALERPQGRLETEDLTYAYGTEEKPVVDHVSIKIEPHGIHALVGRNGSGKTTLLKLLQGLYTPQSGRVLIDGADISQFSRAELAHWLGYVPQECVLFAGSVRENIVHRRPEADDDAVVKAAQAAGVHHFIIDMPDGYATDIGEAGRRLSGGQRQRIAIARALVGDPPVLLLDEPSASLDRQAETELRKTLVEIARERTVIIVTHSPILLAACDDLIALDKGKVALAGPARDILPRLFGQQPKDAAGSASSAAPNTAPNTAQGAPRAPAPKVPPPPKPGAPAPAPAPAGTPGAGTPGAGTPGNAPRPLSPPPTAQPAPQPESQPAEIPSFRGAEPKPDLPKPPLPGLPPGALRLPALKTHQGPGGAKPTPKARSAGPSPKAAVPPGAAQAPAPQASPPQQRPAQTQKPPQAAQPVNPAGGVSDGIPPALREAARRLPVLTTRRQPDGSPVGQAVTPKRRPAANDSAPVAQPVSGPSPTADPRGRPVPVSQQATDTAETEESVETGGLRKKARRRRRKPRAAAEPVTGASADSPRRARRRRRKTPAAEASEPVMRSDNGDQAQMRDAQPKRRPALGSELEDDDSPPPGLQREAG